jgi:hypothetical protein
MRIRVRAFAVTALLALVLAVAGACTPSGGVGAGPPSSPAASGGRCPAGERYVSGRIYPMGACLSDAPSVLASCAPGEHAVVGRVNPLGECYPDVRPTPIRSCPPGERLLVGRVNPHGDCVPAFSP